MCDVCVVVFVDVVDVVYRDSRDMFRVFFEGLCVCVNVFDD